ncbi:MAG: hypothetical protein JNJ64_01320 [Flavobacteriales bacterium]|nr:hypothetical protein [Flavobacteriales bacterium]
MLSSYINVYNTCLVLLRRKGYRITLEMEEMWTAEKDGFVFKADNPIELLGLVGIREELKPVADIEYWWKLDEPNVLSEFE